MKTNIDVLRENLMCYKSNIYIILAIHPVSLTRPYLNLKRDLKIPRKRDLTDMWSLWKPSPSVQKSDSEVDGNSAPLPNKESESEHGNKSSHQLSLLAIRGNTSEPGMMSSLSYTRHSASVLNAESFVASTPAPTCIPHSHEHDIISVSSESTSFAPLYPHDELQTSTQIEDIQSESARDYNEHIRNCYRNVKEIRSVSETPSHFQVPSAEKAVLLRDNSNKNNFTNVSILDLIRF